jgi:hypothetical protein
MQPLGLGEAFVGMLMLVALVLTAAFYIAVLAAVLKVFRIHRELGQLRADVHALMARLGPPGPT